MVKVEIEWREIPFSSSYEINKDGVIRNRKTRKVRASKGPLSYRGRDNKYTSMSVWYVMKLVWPEIVS